MSQAVNPLQGDILRKKVINQIARKLGTIQWRHKGQLLNVQWCEALTLPCLSPLISGECLVLSQFDMRKWILKLHDFSDDSCSYMAEETFTSSFLLLRQPSSFLFSSNVGYYFFSIVYLTTVFLSCFLTWSQNGGISWKGNVVKTVLLPTLFERDTWYYRLARGLWQKAHVLPIPFISLPLMISFSHYCLKGRPDMCLEGQKDLG